MASLEETFRQEGIDIGMAKGKIEGVIETCQDVGLSFDSTVNKVVQRFNLSKGDAVNLVKHYWK